MLYAIAMGHIIKHSAFLRRAAMFNVGYYAGNSQSAQTAIGQ